MMWLHPQQPWIFLPLIVLVAVLVITSIIFLTPKRSTLLDSVYLQKLRVSTAIILCIYLLLLILRNLIVFVLIFFSVGGDSTIFKLPMYAGLGIVAIVTILFWVKGSRLASVLILVAVSWSTYYLVNHRIQAICEPLARAGIARAQLCMVDAMADIFSPGAGSYQTYTLTRKNWATKAAHNGNVRAAYIVGANQKDEKLLRYAIEKGEYRAVEHLIKLLPSNSTEIKTLLEEAANNKDPYAMGMLGRMKINNEGESGFYNGLFLVESAADAGDLESMWYLAFRYAKGDYEFTRKIDESIKWEERGQEREQELIEQMNKLKNNPHKLGIRDKYLSDKNTLKVIRMNRQYSLEKARKEK